SRKQESYEIDEREDERTACIQNEQLHTSPPGCNHQPCCKSLDQLLWEILQGKLKNFMHNLNVKIASWARRKYKNLRSGEMKAIRWLHGISQTSPTIFAHWTMGAKPKNNKSRMNRE